MMKRKRRDPRSRTVVHLPERDLAESILDFAAPLLAPLGATPAPDEARRVIEVAIHLWNAHVRASQFWDDPRPQPLAKLRKAMCGKQAPPGLADSFERLSARWKQEFDLDPRLVESWSFDATDDGGPRLVCQMSLPDGVEAYVPAPAEKRVAIGGKFLDEVQIRESATSTLSYPVEHHRGEVGADGVATIHTKMPTAVQLFAAGLLAPVGRASVDIDVGGKKLGPMVLAEVRSSGYGGHHDIAVLVFRRAGAATST